jgi:sugar lactone lactonase YvrE
MASTRSCSRRRTAALTLALLAGALWPGSIAAAGNVGGRIPLPDGFQPEGIHVEPNGTFYAGSLVDGTILVGNVKTGASHVLVTPPAGRISVGLEERAGLLFVAGGPTGAFVYDASTGATVQAYDVGAGAFVNDVVVTKDAAYFTNSFAAVLYRVPLADGGQPGDIETIPLTGDFQLQDGFNLNGIEASPNGKQLLAVQSNTGDLFRIDPRSGETSLLDVGAASLASGDGLLLRGHTLFVGRNTNVVDVVHLDGSLRSGRLVGEISSEDFDVATTLGRQGDRLYVIQARFDVVPTAETEYWIAVVRTH